MYEFIICDDNNYIVEKVEKVIINEMNNKKFKIKKFNDYNEKFENYVKNNSALIYILDIEMPSNNGIDMAKLIRKLIKIVLLYF